MTKKISIKRITRAPIWIAAGVAFFTFFLHGMGNPKIGQMFLPMHFVALLAGLVDGPAIGFMAGFLMPLLSTLISGLPSFPMFLFMMTEISLYGLFSGLLRKTNIFLNLSISILVGRFAYALAYYVLGTVLSIKMTPVLSLLLSFLTGLPGITIQFIFIPLIYFKFLKISASQKEN